MPPKPYIPNPPRPHINMPAYVLCMSWCAKLEFRVTQLYTSNSVLAVHDSHADDGGGAAVECTGQQEIVDWLAVRI